MGSQLGHDSLGVTTWSVELGIATTWWVPTWIQYTEPPRGTPTTWGHNLGVTTCWSQLRGHNMVGRTSTTTCFIHVHQDPPVNHHVLYTHTPVNHHVFYTLTPGPTSQPPRVLYTYTGVPTWIQYTEPPRVLYTYTSQPPRVLYTYTRTHQSTTTCFIHVHQDPPVNHHVFYTRTPGPTSQPPRVLYTYTRTHQSTTTCFIHLHQDPPVNHHVFYTYTRTHQSTTTCFIHVLTAGILQTTLETTFTYDSRRTSPNSLNPFLNTSKVTLTSEDFRTITQQHVASCTALYKLPVYTHNRQCVYSCV